MINKKRFIVLASLFVVYGAESSIQLFASGFHTRQRKIKRREESNRETEQKSCGVVSLPFLRVQLNVTIQPIQPSTRNAKPNLIDLLLTMDLDWMRFLGRNYEKYYSGSERTGCACLLFRFRQKLMRFFGMVRLRFTSNELKRMTTRGRCAV